MILPRQGHPRGQNQTDDKCRSVFVEIRFLEHDGLLAGLVDRKSWSGLGFIVRSVPRFGVFGDRN
jgi:hypothetical protein